MVGIQGEPWVRTAGAAEGRIAATTSGGRAHSIVGPIGFTGGQPDSVWTSEPSLGLGAGGARPSPGDQTAGGSGSEGGSASASSDASGPVHPPAADDQSREQPPAQPSPTNEAGIARPQSPEGLPPDPSSAPEAKMRDRFQHDYLDLLEGRLTTIKNNIDSHHYEEARIAMLSLEAASGMLGAQALVDRLRELRAIVDFGPASLRNELLAQVRAEATVVRRALEDDGEIEGSGSVL